MFAYGDWLNKHKVTATKQKKTGKSMIEKVSLKEFLRSGQLGRISLGMHEDEVISILGKADAYGGSTRKYPEPSLFVYGDIELFYQYDTRLLTTIVINFWEPRPPVGVGSIELAPWVIKGGLQAEELIAFLQEEGIPWCDVEPINFETRQIVAGSVVTLIFNNNIDEWKGSEGLCKLYAGI
jgi:hypothetical protein